MSPIDRDLVVRKLEPITQNVKQLESIQKHGWETYSTDLIVRKATERLIQETVEAACDINSHVLVENGSGAPPDYRSGFSKLGEAKILTSDDVQTLLLSAGFRNRLVHQYEAIDDKIVFESMSIFLKVYRAYVKTIVDYLDRPK